MVPTQATEIKALLEQARHEDVVLTAEDGTEFILSAAVDFDQELARMRQNADLMALLEERARQTNTVSLDEVKDQLGLRQPDRCIQIADFATIFAHIWYRDFPVHQHYPADPAFRQRAQKADWTRHVGITVRATADLFGLFTYFETRWPFGKKPLPSGKSAGPIDAVIRDNSGCPIVAVEWETFSIHSTIGDELNSKANEIEKLRALCTHPKYAGLSFMAFFGYADRSKLSRSLDLVQQHWSKARIPLLLVIVHYQDEVVPGYKRAPVRVFKEMSMYQVEGGKVRRIREQKCLPWQVKGSRWENLGDTGEKGA